MNDLENKHTRRIIS